MPTRLYSVICHDLAREEFYRLVVEAPDAEEAARVTRERGHLVEKVMPAKRPLPTDSVIRRRIGRCPSCGYNLDGLKAENDMVTCPECGQRSRLVF